MTGFTISGDDADSCVLQNLDGTVKVSLGSDTITVTAPNVIIDSNVTVTGALVAEDGISASGGSGFVITGDIQLTGAFNQTGNMLVTGNIGATGSITPYV